MLNKCEQRDRPSSDHPALRALCLASNRRGETFLTITSSSVIIISRKITYYFLFQLMASKKS
jgi:hypothetical protein